MAQPWGASNMKKMFWATSFLGKTTELELSHAKVQEIHPKMRNISEVGRGMSLHMAVSENGRL